MSSEDKMTIDERRKYLRQMKKRYVKAKRKQRTQLLNEMEKVTELHRKSLIRLMNGNLARQPRPKQRGPTYGPEVDEALHSYLEARPPSDSPYFFVTASGEPLKGESIRSMLRRLGERAGVQHCNAHTFRHTFARNYLRRHGDVETLRRIMGHESIETTRRYLNLVIDDVK